MSNNANLPTNTQGDGDRYGQEHLDWFEQQLNRFFRENGIHLPRLSRVILQTLFEETLENRSAARTPEQNRGLEDAADFRTRLNVASILTRLNEANPSESSSNATTQAVGDTSASQDQTAADAQARLEAAQALVDLRKHRDSAVEFQPAHRVQSVPEDMAPKPVQCAKNWTYTMVPEPLFPLSPEAVATSARYPSSEPGEGPSDSNKDWEAPPEKVGLLGRNDPEFCRLVGQILPGVTLVPESQTAISISSRESSVTIAGDDDDDATTVSGESTVLVSAEQAVIPDNGVISISDDDDATMSDDANMSDGETVFVPTTNGVTSAPDDDDCSGIDSDSSLSSLGDRQTPPFDGNGTDGAAPSRPFDVYEHATAPEGYVPDEWEYLYAMGEGLGYPADDLSDKDYKPKNGRTRR